MKARNKSTKAVFYVLVFYFALGMNLMAFAGGWSNDIRLTNAAGISQAPRLAIDLSGNLHLVWQDERDGNHEVYYKKIDKQGNTLIADKRLTIGSPGEYSQIPDLAIDSSGNVHIVFTNYYIYYLKLDNNGNIIVNQKIISGPCSTMPSIAIDSFNNAHAAWWMSTTQTGNQIHYTKLDNNGNTLVDDIILAPGTTPSGIKIDAQNNIHIAWSGRNSDDEIYYTKLDNSGNKLVDDKRITFSSGESLRVRLVIDSNDNIHLAWIDERDANREIYYIKLDNDGNALTSEIRITNNPGMSSMPSLVADIHNNIHIVWHDNSSGNLHIYYDKLDDNGNILIDNFQLTNGPSYEGGAFIITDNARNLYVVWQDGNGEIYYKYHIFNPDLVSYWKFEEGSGTIANDASGNGNNGTLIGDPTWVDGISGKALEFNGMNNYVKIPDSYSLSSPSSTRAITVMGWVKPDVGLLDVYGRVVASHWTDESGTCPYGDPSNGWTLEAHRDDMKYHSIITAGDGITSVNLASNSQIQKGVWQHVAFTWDGSTIKFYFNGQLDTSAAYSGNLVNSTCFVQIGKTDRLEYTWKGLIDEIRIYNRALSADEIKGDCGDFCKNTCGDVNTNGMVNIQDITYLINYLYKGGTAPNPSSMGDVNCSGLTNIQDITYLINYLYKGGPKPPDCAACHCP